MTDPNQIVVRGRRSRDEIQEEFTFSKDLIHLPETSGYIQDYRITSWNKYQSLPYPSEKDEIWRRTNLKDFHPSKIQIAKNNVEDINLDNGLLKSRKLNRTFGGMLYLNSPQKSLSLETELVKDGVIFVDLQTAEKDYPCIVEKVMGRIVKPGENKFAALAGALAQTGLLLYVPEGVKIERPLYSIMWAPGSNLAFFSHILVYLEDNSSVTFVQEFASPEKEIEKSIHAGVVEIMVGEHAQLNFIELLSWGRHIWDFSTKICNVKKNGKVDWLFGNVGGKMIKNFQTLDLVGAGSSGQMRGFYITNGEQHLDFDTQQNHLAPHTTSDLLYKGVLLDKSRTIWQGMIYVSPEAHGTDGYQANRNLILSSDARADSIPGLEILVDDVRCSHSATVGSLDEDQIFYFQSRGLTKKMAEMMIVEGFLEPIIQTIKIDEIRNHYQDMFKKQINSH